MQWPWRKWRLVRREPDPPAEPLVYTPDEQARRADTDRVAQLVGRIEILEIRRDVQLRGQRYRGSQYGH